jgi:hypothetical protein
MFESQHVQGHLMVGQPPGDRDVRSWHIPEVPPYLDGRLRLFHANF